MSGICGKINHAVDDTVDESLITRMTDSLAHRGPDDEGFYLQGNVGLGFRRLSIIDLETGHQPMSNEDGSVWIVFNGEIYNYPFLRDSLQQKGHAFKTESDTETIIHLYEEYGVDCLSRLRGMFAFALWDEKKQELFLARDRLGQKPLFYYRDGRCLLFASEIKALLRDPGIEREINVEAMDAYLSLQFIPAPHTMFRSIKKLPPAHYAVYRDGHLTMRRYWDVSFVAKRDSDTGENMEELDALLNNSVHMQLRSDVPLGAFLSGGIDSSLLVAYASRISDEKPNTFSVGVDDGDYDELSYAGLVAKMWRTEHRELRIKPRILESLPMVIEWMDEPTDPMAVSVHHISEFTRRHVATVLGGDGGDELFGGYDRYRGNQIAGSLQVVPRFLRNAFVASMLAVVPGSDARKNYLQKLQWLNHLAELPQDRRYFESLSFFRFNAERKNALYSRDLEKKLDNYQAADAILTQYRSSAAEQPLDRMLYTDLTTRLPDYTLLILDRMTMAHGLEARSPYLDHELVEFACSLPPSYKLRGKNMKWLQSRLARKYLPPELHMDDKQGSDFPLNRWIKNDLKEMINDVFASSAMAADGFFDGDYMLRLLDEHSAGRQDHQQRIWSLLNVELWHRNVFARKD